VTYPRIGVDLFPNVEFPFVTVTVVYPGAIRRRWRARSPIPLEEALNTMSGIKVLKSISLESVAQILIQFELEVQVDTAVQDVRDRVSATLRKLPTGIDPPVVQKFDVGARPSCRWPCSGNLPARDLTQLADDVVKTRIQQITGIGASTWWAAAIGKSTSWSIRRASRGAGSRSRISSGRCSRKTSSCRPGGSRRGSGSSR
jgi:HAE1 family hydrophobic/amphiphilic exporter-1